MNKEIKISVVEESYSSLLELEMTNEVVASMQLIKDPDHLKDYARHQGMNK